MCVTWAILKSLYKLVPSRSSVVMLLWDLLVVEMRNPRKWLMDDQWKLLNLPSFALQLWQSRAWWCIDRSTESCVHCLSLYPWCASEYVDLTLPHFRGIMIFANNFCPTKCAPDRGRCLYIPNCGGQIFFARMCAKYVQIDTTLGSFVVELYTAHAPKVKLILYVSSFFLRLSFL